MTPEVISSAYLQGGSVLVIVICFVSLLVWVVKSSEKRENRLYGIIDVLSKELPDIKSELQAIKEEIKRK